MVISQLLSRGCSVPPMVGEGPYDSHLVLRSRPPRSPTPPPPPPGRWRVPRDYTNIYIFFVFLLLINALVILKLLFLLDVYISKNLRWQFIGSRKVMMCRHLLLLTAILHFTNVSGINQARSRGWIQGEQREGWDQHHAAWDWSG